MLLYILLVIVTLLCLLSILLSNGELLSPSVGICVGFVIAIDAAVYNISYWNLNISWKTFIVISSGLVIFMVVQFLVQAFYEKRYAGYQRLNHVIFYPIESVNDDEEIDIRVGKVVILIICVILVSWLYYREVVRFVSVYRGRLNWTETMYYFRHYSSYGHASISIPGYIEQTYQMMVLSGYYFIYILVHNYVATRKMNKSLVVLVVCILLSSFLNSSRIEIIRFPLAAMTFYGMFYEWKTGKSIKIKPKTLLTLLNVFILICILFVLLKSVAGRIDNRDPFYYITYYLGQSIHNLNRFLSYNHQNPEIIGKETFYGFNHLLGLITGDARYKYVAHKEFQFYRGMSIGNVYTTFRAFIHDFGYVGHVILTFLFSLMVNIFYYHIKMYKYKSSIKKSNMFCLIFYGFIIYAVYVAFYADYFFYNISLRLIKAFICWYVMDFYFRRLTPRRS